MLLSVNNVIFLVFQKLEFLLSQLVIIFSYTNIERGLKQFIYEPILTLVNFTHLPFSPPQMKIIFKSAAYQIFHRKCPLVTTI